MPKMKKVLLPILLYSFFILSIYSHYFLYCSSTGLLLLIYCYYSIRTIYFNLNGSFYTREGAEIY